MNNFFAELKRRNVFRVGVAYIIVGWVALQFVDVVDNILSLREWFGKAVLVLVAIGFPFALLLSWAYEVTPEGVKKTHEVDKSKSVTHGTGQKINKLIVGALVLAVGFIVYDKMIASDGPVVSDVEAGQASIAVLPFADLSAAGDQEYFGDGIAEELLNVLANVPGIKVAGRTSSFQFKGQNPDLRTIGETLGVEYILEGSVRTEGNQVRITAQLISARDGFHVWSETYDREVTSIFAIQDEIAENIATALLGPLGAEGLPTTHTGGTKNVEAYNLYLQANFIRGYRTEDNLRQAEGLLKRAVDLDANFANAWGALAKVYILMHDRDYISTEVATRELNNAAEKALVLDPENSEALASLGLFKAEVDLDFLGARDLLERAIKSNPNDIEAHHWYNFYLLEIGSIKEGLEGMKINYERDPFYQITLRGYLYVALSAGQIEEVKKVLVMVDEGQMGQRFEGSHAFYHFAIALMEDNIPEAKKQLAIMEKLTGERPHDWYYLLTGSEEDKKLVITQAQAGYQAGETNDFDMARFFSFLGDYETALPYARRVVDNQCQGFFLSLMYGAHPDMDPGFRKFNPDLSPLLPQLPEYVEAYERAGIDIYEMLEIERPADE